jgi:methyl-accepting chemotaxis protein
MRKTFAKKLIAYFFAPMASLLILWNVLFLWVYRGILQALDQLHGGDAVAHRIAGPLLGALAALDVISLLAGTGAAYFLYTRIAAPILRIREALPQGEGQSINLAANLPVAADDDLGSIAAGFNGFQDRLRRAVGTIRKAGVNTAYLSCLSLRNIRETMQSSRRQSEIATGVFEASQRIVQTIEETSDSAAHIAEATSRELETARRANRELADASEQVAIASAKLESFQQVVQELSSRSRSIDEILTLIQDIADQTNLLALNAGIEAARVGEAGRGFAIVAGEVRKVAQRTGDAAGRIAQDVSGIMEKVSETLEETNRINSNNQQIKLVMEEAAQHFHGMIQEFEQTHAQLGRMNLSIEQIANTNQEIHSGVTEIRDLSAAVVTHMEESVHSSSELNMQTEEILGMVSLFQTGSGRFEEVLSAATGYRNRIEQVLEGVCRRGVNLFDYQYLPVPGTTPQKFEVGYSKYFDQEVLPLYDEAKKELGASYVTAVDVNGYLVIHNSEWSRPLTGNAAEDARYSRHRRFFKGNEVEIKRARNAAPYLLQSYSRDTGEVLDDIALPITVRGRRWGSMCIGISPERLLENSEMAGRAAQLPPPAPLPLALERSASSRIQ